ncbi:MULTISPECIES: STAS domain-containing protein [Streptomyces]|uniref:STAS domain-containing protein n=1 Tax=Streptomyces fungicidicus TaxID=68203 RepID=A0ACC7Y931_9ACTN|nr:MULTISPECIES: STAS domain-containing protein [Streptomyces]MBF4135794.1 STAS domain-containing protein [Streptomyces albidoflavus]MBO1283869.1 STAS domain-containing protein [Streptomyces sampsonii]NUV78091.1 STAS domain-containing protein [Streptomyces fungicidicus]
MTRHLTHRTRITPAGPVLELIGELDHHTAPEARAVLAGLTPSTGQQLVLDLGDLAFCDSTGLTVLITARNHALAANATVVLAAVPAHLSRIFRIVGLNQVFAIHRTAQDAETAWHAVSD